MALTGLDIYKLLPKTNCKECGFTTCLAFAMALAQKKVSLDKCPHVTAAVREALESASQPPIKLVTIGVGERKLEIGNETVMYRHEQKFYHPCGIGVLLEDTLSDSELAGKLSNVGALKFERVGQMIGVDLVCLKDSSKDKARFIDLVNKASAVTDLNIILDTADPSAMADAVRVCKERRPLILCDDTTAIDAFVKIAKENNLPIAVTVKSLDEAAAITEKMKKDGVAEIIINIEGRSISGRVQDFTLLRRTALKKNFRPLGFPTMAFTTSREPDMEMAEAASYVLKYAGIVIMKNVAKEFVFPVLVARQDVYQDPQKPVQVEPKVYEIGKATKDSPVLVTTNFSITYFTVAGEVESSKVPSYILSCDSEGMSVLTAWAAEKFTPETIVESVKKSGVGDIVGHRKLIIPGYVSVMSGKLEEISGWKIAVGPREASGIPNYLRSYK